MTTAGNQGQNNYPAPGNYPASSFPQPVPAPDIDPDAGEQVTVRYGRDWQEVLMGSLDQLRNPATWEGEHDDIILALNRATNLKDMLQREVEADVPTPYWDDTTDLDDEEPAATQSWYGIFDGEFHETVENFVIAGFLAYSGNIGGAVAFLTFAPKFRLAWKKGGLGGAIRVFIDGVDAGLIDTQSDTEGVIEKDFVGDPDFESHTILQVLEMLPI